MIPYGKQNLDAEDIQSVVDVLRSPLITQGKGVPAFERSISEKSAQNIQLLLIVQQSALQFCLLSSRSFHKEI